MTGNELSQTQYDPSQFSSKDLSDEFEFFQIGRMQELLDEKRGKDFGSVALRGLDVSVEAAE